MRNLWYVRQGEKISGPYPEQLVARHVLLGRYKRHDQVSVDQSLWVALEDVPELLPVDTVQAANEDNPDKRAWYGERQKASLRWRDERNVPDRRIAQKLGSPLHPIRSTKDRRRMDEGPETMAMRQRHADNELQLKKNRERFYSTAAVLITVAFALLIVVSVASPVIPVKVGMVIPGADCKQPPGQQVNWSGCDKNGVKLAGANLRNANLVTAHMQGASLNGASLDYAQLGGVDLTMADLSRASLIGANLTGADLTSANLSGADLHFADLRGASLDNVNLDGAILDNTVWIDGKVCGPDSVGQCR